MNRARFIVLISAPLFLMSCGPVKTPEVHEYTLDNFSAKQYASHPTQTSLLISPPEAVADFQTEQMQYVKKPHELNAFTKNAWASPPASLLYPLMIQSLQRSGYFYAVASGAYSDTTDYRLDTQLIELKQNFIKKPSVVQLAAKITLTHIADNRVIATQTIRKHVRCRHESPYGGVIAANMATNAFTLAATDFVIKQIKQDKSS